MSRLLKVMTLLLVGVASIGCRACYTCYDYAPPVADCQCSACGGGRSGSAMPGTYADNQDSTAPAVQVAEQPTNKLTR